MSFVDAALGTICGVYNQLIATRDVPVRAPGSPPELWEIEQRAAARRTDISDHLTTLFSEALAAHPRLIVELGVRGGESTFAFERAAGLSDACLLSVDIEDCGVPCSYAKWSFVKRDDVAFADEFAGWCAAHNLPPLIDVLFIDTSHLYEHTREELRVWMPFLAPKGRIILHDTNLTRLYRRADGSLGVGWNNQRGVIRALEDALGEKFDERRDFATTARGWTIRHRAHCGGLTVLERN